MKLLFLLGLLFLNDLPVIGSNELVLEIKEADGRIRKSTHYFTTMPNQLKKVVINIILFLDILMIDITSLIIKIITLFFYWVSSPMVLIKK